MVQISKRAAEKAKQVQALVNDLKLSEWRAIKEFVDRRYTEKAVKIRLDDQSCQNIESEIYWFK